jgi:hypothetical protein
VHGLDLIARLISDFRAAAAEDGDDGCKVVGDNGGGPGINGKDKPPKHPGTVKNEIIGKMPAGCKGGGTGHECNFRKTS